MSICLSELREKCTNTEFFLVCIWTLFTQWWLWVRVPPQSLNTTDISTVPRGEFLDVQATSKWKFPLKRLCDMSNVGTEYTSFYGLNTKDTATCLFIKPCFGGFYSLYNAHAIFAQVLYRFKAVNIWATQSRWKGFTFHVPRILRLVMLSCCILTNCRWKLLAEHCSQRH